MKICEMSNLLEMLLTTHILDHFPEHPSLSTTEFELRRAVRKPKQNSKQVMTTVFSCLHVPYETENANKLTNWTVFPSYTERMMNTEHYNIHLSSSSFKNN